MTMLRCARLMYLTMRGYVKRILFLVAVGIVGAIVPAHGARDVGVLILSVVLIIIPAMWILYMVYIWDKVPQIFLVMPQRRVDFVRAMYFNYLSQTIAGLVLGILASALVHAHDGSSSQLFLYPIIICVVLVVSIIIPFTLRFGYAKLRLALFAFGIIPVLVPLVIRLVGPTNVFTSTSNHFAGISDTTRLFGMLIIGLVIVTVSYALSVRAYQRKDI